MVKQSSKGQVSLEYLMTYGIAIAIVVIAVAALYSMGVFSPKSSAVSCSPCFANFAYVDYANGQLMMKNGPKALGLVNCTSTPANGTCNVAGVANASISANQQFNLTGMPITPGSTVALTLTYTDALSTLVHTDTATIHN